MKHPIEQNSSLVNELLEVIEHHRSCIEEACKNGNGDGVARSARNLEEAAGALKDSIIIP